jgi:TolA-binding protein
MKTVSGIFVIAGLALSLTRCSNTELLETENAQLRARVDSLEIARATTVRQNSSLEERIGALEDEKRALTSKNQPEKVVIQAPPSQETIKFDVVPAGKAPQNPSSIIPAPDDFVASYQEALSAFNARGYQRAQSLFERLLASSRPNELTDNCIYWIGECMFALKNYRSALDQFTKVIELKESDKLDDALMMRGNSYLKVKQSQPAREDFLRLISDFPTSEYVSRAKEKLQSIR